MKILVTTIIGKPNAGKSSLMNSVLNFNVSIVNDKPQTTRDQITGIYNNENEQFVFVDTPGIHKSKTELGKKMNEFSYSSLKNIDLVMFLSPIDLDIEEIDKEIISKLTKIENKIAIITKIDLIKDKEKLNKRAQELLSYNFKNVIGYSVKENSYNVLLLNELRKYAYDGEPFYNTEDYTDKSMRFIAKELIRQSVLELCFQEIPYNVAVNIDEYYEHNDENLRTEIHASIYVSRESQKGILIGKEGSMIKKISIMSRKKIEEILDEEIILKIKVKVSKNWLNDEKELKKFDY